MVKLPSVLVIVDAQNGFQNSHTFRVIPSIVAIVRAHLGPTLFTQFVNRDGSNFERLLNWSNMKDGAATEFVKELQPFINTKNTFQKSGYSAFSSATFTTRLKELAIQRVEICGFDTDACVLATAFDAFDAGYHPLIHVDACGSSGGNHLHLSSIEVLQRNFGKHSIVRAKTSGPT